MKSDILSDHVAVGHVISANDLLLGDVVYATTTGNWTRYIEEASVLFEDDDVNAALEQAQGQVTNVVGAYLVQVSLNVAGKPVPTHYREKIRVNGPSTSSDLSRLTRLNNVA